MANKKAQGKRAKTRNVVAKRRLTVNDFMKEFENGDKVAIDIQPQVHSGLPPFRFRGKIGDIVGKQGEIYKVKIKDGNKEKILLVHPIHLKKLTS